MKSFRIVVFTTLILSLALTALAKDKKETWRPVTPEELALKTPLVEKDADAEAIFWEVRYDEKTFQGDVRHYVRLKIFTDRGRDKFSRIDLEPDMVGRITEVKARVIKPDGSIVEVTAPDIHTRRILNTRNRQVEVVSFAVPGLEIGSIVEYTYHETSSFILLQFEVLFQREVPVHDLAYYVRKVGLGGIVRVRKFNLPSTFKFEPEKDDFYVARLKNVPALHPEPYLPPLADIRPWILIYESRDTSKTPGEYWQSKSRYLYDHFDIWMKPDANITRQAQELTAGATTADQKLRLLYEFCQTKFNNLIYDRTLNSEQKAKIKLAKKPSETLKRQLVPYSDIGRLFASLARALGFEAAAAYTGDRSKGTFNRSQRDGHWFHQLGIAVKVDGTWRFFDPGATFLPYGMLTWTEEGSDALIVDEKETIWVTTPVSKPEQNLVKRVGRFKLSADGALEGTVRVEYSGQFAHDRKYDNLDASGEQQESALLDQLRSRFSTAEVSELAIENPPDSNQPQAHSFKIKVPDYGQITGQRLLVRPGFFERGNSSPFISSERKFNIWSPHTWSEQDDITIELPPGFTVENREQPTAVNSGAIKGIAGQTIAIAISEDNRTMSYRRDFSFGNTGRLQFHVSQYPELKAWFDAAQQANEFAVMLRQQ